MKKINILLILLSTFFLIGIVSADNYYVTSPNNCPNSYQSQTCSGSNKVCGYNGGVTFCWDMSTINAPVGSITTTGTGGTDYTCSDTTCSGGLIIDCYSYTGSAPFCNNNGAGLCDRNATCYNKHVQTTCTGGSWITSSCSATCTTNYFACDGSTSDSNGCEIHAGDSCGAGTGTIANNQCYNSSAGNCTSATKLDCNNDDGDGNLVTCNGADGCEITNGGSCTVGSLSGTYNGCTCTVSKSYFQTGTFIEYLTNITQNAMLWFKNYGTQNLINATGSTNKSFVVDNEANIITDGNITFSSNGNKIWSNTTCLQLKGSTVTMLIC